MTISRLVELLTVVSLLAAAVYRSRSAAEEGQARRRAARRGRGTHPTARPARRDRLAHRRRSARPTLRPAPDQVSLEPGPRQSGDFVERAGLFEEVRRAGDDLERLLAAQLGQRRSVHLDDR